MRDEMTAVSTQDNSFKGFFLLLFYHLHLPSKGQTLLEFLMKGDTHF